MEVKHAQEREAITSSIQERSQKFESSEQLLWSANCIKQLISFIKQFTFSHFPFNTNLDLLTGLTTIC
jgi:hypothetical protein